MAKAMRTASPNKCETRLLDDAPAREDAFGAHLRVAHAITELVGAEEGGKGIALIGGYGSGKSTIVQLAKEALETRNSSRVVVFDSWSHQGDPLRRSFLEELIRFLTQAEWTPKGHWDGDLDALAGKKESSRTITSPRLTPAGRAIAISALLVPLGYLLLADSFVKQTLMPPNFLSLSTVWWGLTLALAPLLAVLAVYAWLRPNLAVWTRKFWLSHRGRPEGESVWAAFVERTIQEHQTETVRSVDPTSLEFERIFGRLMEATLTKGRILVVVIDNLDRLPSDEAQVIWATMQTFFGSSGNQSEWRKRMWLLVPFNPEGINRIWSDRSDEKVSKSFVDKTFQAAFRVSPPILSNWRDFFVKSLATAFPSHSDPEFDRIYRLYRRIAAPADKPVTPRELKAFVNDVGVLHRQWQDEIGLVVMACFVLNKDKIDAHSDTLTNPEFLDSGVMAILGDSEWPRDFAALHFNVARESGVQVLIGRQVESGLTQGSLDELLRLSQVPGFEAVCQSVVEDRHGDWPAEDGRSVLNAAAMLLQLQKEGFALQAMTELVLQDLQKIQTWSLTREVGESIVAVAASANDIDRPQLARRLVEQTIESAPAETVPAEALKDWAEGYTRVIRQVPPMATGHSWLKVGVPGRPEQYVAVLPFLADLISYPETQPFTAPLTATSADVVRVLTDLASADRLDATSVQAIRAMLRLKIAWPWEGLVISIDKKVRAISPEVAIKGPPIMCLLALAAQSVGSASKVVAALGPEGYFSHHIHLASVAADNDALATLVLGQLLYNPSGEVTAHVGQSSAGQTLYRSILASPEAHDQIFTLAIERITRRVQVETLVANANKESSPKRAIAKILSSLLSGTRGADLASAEHFVANYAAYSAVLEPSALTELTRSMVGRNALSEAVVKKGFTRELAPLYRSVWTISGKSATALEAVLVSGLRQTDRATWSQELTSGELPELVGEMASSGSELSLGKDLEDALLDYGKVVLGGGAPRDLRGELVAKPDGHVGNFLSVFGDELVASGLLVEEADELLRKVGRAIVERRDIGELNWLERVLTDQSPILKSAAEETVASLIERVADARSTTTDNVALTAVLDRIFLDLGGTATTEGGAEVGHDSESPAPDG